MKVKANQSESLLGDAESSELMEHDNESSGLEDNSEDEGSGNRVIDYKAKYNDLKRKVKILVYENVYFQNNLQSSQRRLLKVTRDCSFLLDRLLAYERPELSSSDNDQTDSTDDSSRLEPTPKRRKAEPSSMATALAAKHAGAGPPMKRTRKGPKKQQQPRQQLSQETQLPGTSYRSILATSQQVVRKKSTNLLTSATANVGPGRAAPYDLVPPESPLTKEEIERHLQSRQKLPEVVPEGELPTDMFNNSPSSESNDQRNETSPSNFGEDCLSVYSQ